MSDAYDDRPLVDPVRTRQVVSRGRWFVLLSAIVGAVLGYAAVNIEFGIQTKYSSSVDLQLAPTAAELEFVGDALGGSPSSQARSFVRTSTEILTSDDVIATAISILTTTSDSAALGVTDVGDIRDAITVDQIEGSFIVRVTVALRDAVAAAGLADALISAYDVERSVLENRAIERLENAHTQKIEELKAVYADLVVQELEKRREIGALTLDAEITQQESDLEVQSSALYEDQISLAAAGRGGTPPASSTNVRAQLEARIEERALIIDILRQDLADAGRKQALLQPLLAEQRLVLETIAELNSARLGISTRRIAGPSETIILRNSGVAETPDPPTAIQGAFFGGVAGFMLASTLMLLLAVVTPPPRDAASGRVRPR